MFSVNSVLYILETNEIHYCFLVKVLNISNLEDIEVLIVVENVFYYVLLIVYSKNFFLFLFILFQDEEDD